MHPIPDRKWSKEGARGNEKQSKGCSNLLFIGDRYQINDICNLMHIKHFIKMHNIDEKGIHKIDTLLVH